MSKGVTKGGYVDLVVYGSGIIHSPLLGRVGGGGYQIRVTTRGNYSLSKCQSDS